MKRFRLLSVGLLVGALLGIMTTDNTVWAAKDANSNISRSYSTSQELRGGTIVSLRPGKADVIEPTSTSNQSRVLGVVVEAGDSLVAVDPDINKAQVAVSGTGHVLVSTINGVIRVGDTVVASPLSGIGMKGLSEGGGYIIGRATSSFDARTEGATTQQVTDKSGNNQTISIGYLTVNLSPGFSGEAGNGATGLQRWVRSLTGRTVSMPRIITSLVIAILTLATIVVLMYAAIYGSIISIGRNPLARKSIVRALLHVVLMAVLAVGLAFVLIFMLLR